MAKPHMFGIAELAAATGRPRGTIAQWYRRGKLPDPTARLAMGPVWTGPDIEDWITAHRIPNATLVPDPPSQSEFHEQIAQALARLGFPPAVTTQVLDELRTLLEDPAGRQTTDIGLWCVNRATEIRNELSASRRSPPPPADEPEDTCPHGLGWLECKLCMAAGEELKRRGLRAFLSTFKPIEPPVANE